MVSSFLRTKTFTLSLLCKSGTMLTARVFSSTKTRYPQRRTGAFGERIFSGEFPVRLWRRALRAPDNGRPPPRPYALANKTHRLSPTAGELTNRLMDLGDKSPSVEQRASRFARQVLQSSSWVERTPEGIEVRRNSTELLPLSSLLARRAWKEASDRQTGRFA